MKHIIPFLWFNDNAEEAVKFYTSVFKNSKAGHMVRYDDAGSRASGRPKGSVMTASFTLEGQEFAALNGGPVFTFTQAVSYFVCCSSIEEIDELWGKLSDGGKVLMEFQKYPFSEKYGWCDDKFGLSWQLFLGPARQKITPLLMFVKNVAGKAEEAMNFYVSVFSGKGSGASSVLSVARYGVGMGEPEQSVVHGEFKINDHIFMAMDSSLSHAPGFSEANSFVVNCDTQEEIDYFWEKLSEGGTEGQCGWLKDKYGLSWQVVPTILEELLSGSDHAKSQRVMEAMITMTKFNMQALKEAHDKE